MNDGPESQRDRSPEPAADHTSHIVTVRPASETMSVQGLGNFVGISADTSGATGLAMNLVVIPPGGQAKAHFHDGFETAIDLLQGEVETLYGRGLTLSVINRAGDFLFIPPSVPHRPRNTSDTLPAIALVARNDPREQESVVLYGPDAGPVPAKAGSR
ncbi:MAG: cupin domain-containing protein [Microvirga sp.]